MKNIIIVGSGPVGSFMAVLCAQLGFQVTVYEKRHDFTRSINVKIKGSFFKEVQEVLSRLNLKTEFFAELSKENNGVFKIKDLEKRFAREAKSLGAKYITQEVESFEELYNEHKASDPIILDCTGRNSKLRINEFGPDKDNIDSVPLQHAMYVNFRAKVANDMSSFVYQVMKYMKSIFKVKTTKNMSSLYQVMKYVKDIKLTEIVLSKHKDKDGFSDVTLPVFITDELASIFDKEYPNISREPLNPFNSSAPDNIFFLISSLLGSLIVDGYNVDLNSVEVKKIEISCGYAKKRSKDNYVCLGDSAVHLAFFRSLNLGLQHALELFIKLSTLQINVQASKDNQYKGQVVNELNQTWSNLLANFEAKRDEDIKSEVNSNKMKSVLYDHLSWFININGKSFIKISELARVARGKYSLFPKDFEFFLECFKARRENVATSSMNVISSLLNQLPGEEFDQLKKICVREDLSDEEKVKLIGDAANSKLTETKRKRGYSSSISSNADVSSYFILTLIKNEIAQVQKLSSEPNSILNNLEPVAGASWSKHKGKIALGVAGLCMIGAVTAYMLAYPIIAQALTISAIAILMVATIVKVYEELGSQKMRSSNASASNNTEEQAVSTILAPQEVVGKFNENFAVIP